MNEQLQVALVGIIEKAVSGIDSSVSFLTNEIPDVIAQLLLFKVTSSAVYIALSISMLFCAYKFWSKVFNEKLKQDEKENWAWKRSSWSFENGKVELRECISIVAFISSIFIVSGSVICFFTNLIEILQLVIAPKIWLLEYAANLVK